MNLTRLERITFATWLRERAKESDDMSNLLASLPFTGEAMVKHFRAVAAAFMFVADHTQPGEEMPIGPEDVGEAKP